MKAIKAAGGEPPTSRDPTVKEEANRTAQKNKAKRERKKASKKRKREEAKENKGVEKTDESADKTADATTGGIKRSKRDRMHPNKRYTG